MILSLQLVDELTSDKKLRDIPCPDIIVDYNKYMGGMDLADQAMCYYSVGRKRLKWWRKIFWRMHDQAVTNAFVLHNFPCSTKVKPQKHFRMQLVYALTSRAYELRRHPGRPHSTALSEWKAFCVQKFRTETVCSVCIQKTFSKK